MRLTASVMLAAFALVAPVVAQKTEGQKTEGQQTEAKANTEKLWRIEVSGIGGWGAASTAKRVSSILDKHKDIKDLVFDTTGVGYFEFKNPKKQPEADAFKTELNELLVDKRAGKGVTIRVLREVELPKAEVVYECSIAGLAWGATAVETRDVLSKLDGVIRVHPNGLNGKALVYVKDKDKVTKEQMEEALAKTEKLRLRKMEKA